MWQHQEKGSTGITLGNLVRHDMSNMRLRESRIMQGHSRMRCSVPREQHTTVNVCQEICCALPTCYGLCVDELDGKMAPVTQSGWDHSECQECLLERLWLSQCLLPANVPVVAAEIG